MTTRMTKTWFDGENIVTQEIPEAELYKRPWQGLTEEDWEYVKDSKGTSLDTFDHGAAWAADQLMRRNT